MVHGIDLVVGAGLVDGNAIHHMEVISSVKDMAVLKVWRELIQTAVLVLLKLAMAVDYLTPAFLELWLKPTQNFLRNILYGNLITSN